MKHKDDVWGWMLAADFFLAGMGGGMLVIIGLAHFIWGKHTISLISAFAAPIFIAMGSGLLILELGRPFQGWRVFLKPQAILTIGAWNMLFAIGFGFCYALFFIPDVPWENWIGIQNIFAALSVITGLVVATYPGILLGGHNSRPFWSGPGIMTLFLTSSMSTGFAAHQLFSALLPPFATNLSNILSAVIAVALTCQVIFWFGYLYIKQTRSTDREEKASQRWIKGEFSGLFWIGFMLLGTLLPLILVLIKVSWALILGDILIIMGGALMRLMVIHSGDQRTWLPGEEKYRSRLPKGDEPFINAWK